MIQSSVLIVSDDTEFARSIAARWQAERHVPDITLATSDVWHPASSSGYDLVIVGKVRRGKRSSILSDVSTCTGTAAVYVADEERDIPLLRADYPHLLVVPQQDGWAGTLILVSIEALKRVEAVGRAQRADVQPDVDFGEGAHRGRHGRDIVSGVGRSAYGLRPTVRDARGPSGCA